MDVEAHLICQLCQTEFHTEEDISLHSCIDIVIKQEKQESKIEDPLGVYDSSDLDVSEEFFDAILKQVDVLCYIINNGDSNLNRTIKVNHILSTALSCYKIHSENQIEDDLNSKKYLDQHVDDLPESENDEMETQSESDLCKNDIKDMDVISKEAKGNKHKSKDFTTTETAKKFPNWKKQIEDDLNSKEYLEQDVDYIPENDDLETESESDLSRNDYKEIPPVISKDTKKNKHKSRKFVETESESDLSMNDIKNIDINLKEAKENKHNSKDLTTTKTANFYPTMHGTIIKNDDIDTESESDLSRNDYKNTDVISKEERKEDRTKIKEIRYECNFCDKTFTLKGSLKTHVQNLHDSKDFTKSKNFHSTIPNQNDPIKDSGNRSGYITKRHLLPYVIHNSEDEFNCSICSKSYSQKLNLFEHLKLKHKKEVEQERSANVIHRKPKTRQKGFVRSKELIDRMFEFVKSQCGEHKNNEMARMLGLPKTTVIQRIQKEGIVFSKKQQGDCHFCDLKKYMPNTKHTKKELLQYSKYYRVKQKNSKQEKLQCLLCKESYWLKCDLLQHFKFVHRSELMQNKRERDTTLRSEKEEVVYNDEPLEDCISIDEMKQDSIKNSIKDLINCSKTRVDPFLQNTENYGPKRLNDYLTEKCLLPYMLYNSNEDVFQCLICSKSYNKRFKLFRHLRLLHRIQIVKEQKQIADIPKNDSSIKKE